MSYLKDVLKLSQHGVHLSVQQPAKLLFLRTARRQTYPVPAAPLAARPLSPSARRPRPTSTARSAALAAIAVAMVRAESAVSEVCSQELGAQRPPPFLLLP